MDKEKDNLEKEIKKAKKKLEKLMSKTPKLDEEHKDYGELRDILYKYIVTVVGYGDDSGFIYFDGINNTELFHLVEGIIKLIKHITYGEWDKIERKSWFIYFKKE